MKRDDLKDKEIEALRHIRNFLVHEGRMPSIRKLADALGYSSPRSAFIMTRQLIKKGFLEKREDGRLRLIKDLSGTSTSAQTVDIPLVGSVACGTPIFAEENIEAMIPVSTELARGPHKYFFLHAQGNSMDEAGINDGDLVLVRQQQTANEGDKVVALIDSDATIKEFHRTNSAIVLKPISSDKKHQPIILTRDFQVQGIVITTIPDFRR